MRAVFVMLLGSSLVLATGAARSARAAVQTNAPSVFQRLFPNPTGQNGFEEIVQAGELAQSSKALRAAQDPDATLATKRRAMDDPAAVRALRMLRAGLAKPIHVPPDELDNPHFEIYALTRGLARLLNVEQYVLLADGKVGAAIDSLRDGLKLGYVIQSDKIIGGLVGIAVDAIVLTRIAKHLDQLSARDCDRLVALANEWLALPDPRAAALRAEQGAELKQFDKLFAATGVLPPPELDENDEEAAAAFDKELQTFLKLNPANAQLLMGLVRGHLTSFYDRVISELQRPPWERKEVALPEGNSLDARMFRGTWGAALTPVVSGIMDKWTRDVVQVQLLGVHAAIRRYKWEYARLPNTLDELKLGRLAIDPFNGKPLVYKPMGDTYELSSAGPLDRGDDQRAPSGERVPIFLPNRPKG